MLGRGGMYADQCRKEGFIGVDFDVHLDMTDLLTTADSIRDFNKAYVPLYLKERPDKSKTAATLAGDCVWTVCKGLQVGDVALTPNGRGEFYVGRLEGAYYYVYGSELPHRRKVKWMDGTISRAKMSDKLRHSTGAIGTCCDVSGYADEIEKLISCGEHPVVVAPPIEQKSFQERDLHRLLCTSLRARGIYAKNHISRKDPQKG